MYIVTRILSSRPQGYREKHLVLFPKHELLILHFRDGAALLNGGTARIVYADSHIEFADGGWIRMRTVGGPDDGNRLLGYEPSELWVHLGTSLPSNLVAHIGARGIHTNWFA